jgi:hypothetical protein
LASLIDQLVKTVSAQVTLWRLRRETARLRREFPPRFGIGSLWAALGLLLLAPMVVVMWQMRTLHQARHGCRPFRPPPLAEARDKVFFTIISTPIGARALVTWPGGSKERTTPLGVEVPRNSKVRIVISHPDMLPYETTVIADEPQVFRATLQEAAGPVGDVRDDRGRD